MVRAGFDLGVQPQILARGLPEQVHRKVREGNARMSGDTRANTLLTVSVKVMRRSRSAAGTPVDQVDS